MPKKITRKAITAIPDGVYGFEDFLDDDGTGRERIGIRVRIEIRGDEAVVDFTESDEQVARSRRAGMTVSRPPGYSP